LNKKICIRKKKYYIVNSKKFFKKLSTFKTSYIKFPDHNKINLILFRSGDLKKIFIPLFVENSIKHEKIINIQNKIKKKENNYQKKKFVNEKKFNKSNNNKNNNNSNFNKRNYIKMKK
jgi:hypothetical protein